MFFFFNQNTYLYENCHSWLRMMMNHFESRKIVKEFREMNVEVRVPLDSYDDFLLNRVSNVNTTVIQVLVEQNELKVVNDSQLNSNLHVHHEHDLENKINYFIEEKKQNNQMSILPRPSVPLR